MTETENVNEPIESKHESLFAPTRFVERLEDCFFYHTMDLPGLGTVRGQWDLRGRFRDYIGGVSVAGKSVLDIGTATGFLSFESEKHGAARVVSFDLSNARQQMFIPFKDKSYYCDYETFVAKHAAEIERWKNAYWLCHRLLTSQAKVFYGDIFRLPPELGQFDVAITGAVLEHLNDQITALASIARLTKETLVIVTPVLATDERIARLEPTADNPDYDFTWWRYSVGAYREILKILGFGIARITEAQYRYEHGDRLENRSTIVAVRD
ncbi:MAG TPA: class I SAM-dependent methyltransferase [Pyrinomonadaceae bacterium]|jgi:SAM-dependent methyltransferase|nr:class I SAM-dependent methyltransferase [Pyrinomonadaceae bacterium]